jgi:hypothetical protein
MYTLFIVVAALGFFMLYNTSRKAKLSTSGSLEKWMQAHHKPAKITGLFLIILSIIAMVVKQGVGVGMLTSFTLLMATGCIIVAVAPLHYFRLKHIVLIVAGSLLLELFIF